MTQLNPLVYRDRVRLHPLQNAYEVARDLGSFLVGGYLAGKVFSRLSGGKAVAMAIITGPVALIAQRVASNLDRTPLNRANRMFENGRLRVRHDAEVNMASWQIGTVFAPLLVQLFGYQAGLTELTLFWIGAGTVRHLAAKACDRATSKVGYEFGADYQVRNEWHGYEFGADYQVWNERHDYEFGANYRAWNERHGYEFGADYQVRNERHDYEVGADYQVWNERYGHREYETRRPPSPHIAGVELNKAAVNQSPPKIKLENLPNVQTDSLVNEARRINWFKYDQQSPARNILLKLNKTREGGGAYAEFRKLMRNLTAKILALPEEEDRAMWLQELGTAFGACGAQWQDVAERVYLRLVIPGGDVSSIIAQHNHELKKQILRGWCRFMDDMDDVHYQHNLQVEFSDELGLTFVGTGNPEAVVAQQLGEGYVANNRQTVQNIVAPFKQRLLQVFFAEYTANRLVEEHLTLFRKGTYYNRFRDFLYTEVADAARTTKAQAQNLVEEHFHDDDYMLNQASVIFALQRTGHLLDDGVIVHGKKNSDVLPK